jgi:hypothetical protein
LRLQGSNFLNKLLGRWQPLVWTRCHQKFFNCFALKLFIFKFKDFVCFWMNVQCKTTCNLCNSINIDYVRVNWGLTMCESRFYSLNVLCWYVIKLLILNNVITVHHHPTAITQLCKFSHFHSLSITSPHGDTCSSHPLNILSKTTNCRSRGGLKWILGLLNHKPISL